MYYNLYLMLMYEVLEMGATFGSRFMWYLNTVQEACTCY
jgi:hypothetical protein